jgi:Glycosyl transferase family 11
LKTNIYLVPYGGLGNQLFQCAAALAFSKDQSVSVLCNWGFARKNKNMELEMQSLQWSNNVKFKDLPRLDSFSKRILNLLLRLGAENKKRILLILLEWLGSVYFSVILKKVMFVYINRGLGFDGRRNRSNALLLGYFQCTNYVSKVKKEMLKIYPKDMSAKTINLINQLKNREVLVIHVRRGDYLNEPFGVLEDSYYEKALNEIEYERFDEMWVFSDDLKIAKQMAIFKQSRSVKFVDDSDLSSAETLEIMRHGSGFIIANSSFSWWAAQLKYKPEAQVLSPTPWFKSIESPNQIIDTNWKLVQW